METDCKSLISRGEKEYSRYGARSLDNRKHGYLYRYMRRVKRKWPGGIQDWIRSHPERRKGIGAFTSADARITIADAFAGKEDPESVLEDLGKPRMRNCNYELLPSHIHRVSAKEVLESIFAPGDFCWIDENDFPLTASLMSQDVDDLTDYLEAREKSAQSGSRYTWTDSEVGLLGHMWKKTRKFRSHAERKAQVHNIWDKRMHGRNQQKFLKLPNPPLCPLCETAIDSQAHYALRCSHPYFQRAREGMEQQIMQRIRQLPSGAGKAFIWKQWQWVLYPEDNTYSVKEEMARLGFMQGRPLKAYLEKDGADTRIGKQERPELLECIQDMWLTVDTYLYHVWKLRGSITSAPIEVQRTLRTHVATPKDLHDLIRNPYYARSHKRSSHHWMSSLAKFCQHRRHLQPVAAEVDTGAPEVNGMTASKWDPEWSRWLSRNNTVSKRQDKNKSSNRRLNKKRKQRGPRNSTQDPL